MFKRVTDWIRRRAPARFFEAFQIEVTSRCSVRCEMCPRSVLADRWPEVDLPWQSFQRIARAFDRVEHVHLQGWGEPLLHPRLFDMIALAKGAGCRVGLTTNGMGLDRNTGKRLLDLNLNLLAVSIAGATRETHERIRVHSNFALILEQVRQFLNLRAGRVGGGTKAELSYLMATTNIAELPQAVELATSLGVDELYAINLDYLVTPTHGDLRVFGRSRERDGFARIVEEARARARRAGLAFRAYPLDLDEVAVCEAHPTKILFVSCEGWVSPCTYLSLPGQSEIPRWFDGKRVTVPAMRFGNIQDRELMEIWEGRGYQEFRERFAARCLGLATRAFAAFSGGESGDAKMVPPPEPCRTCYKLYGV
jgi:MoaA/NifB/PqqE/SkfB family radical SAM enzyme